MIAQQDDLVSFNIRKLPRSLRMSFKAFCLRRQIDMQDAVAILMRKALRGEVDVDDEEEDGDKPN